MELLYDEDFSVHDYEIAVSDELNLALFKKVHISFESDQRTLSY